MDESDHVLAEPLVNMEPSTTGIDGRGIRFFGVEQFGAFTLETLFDLDTRNMSTRIGATDLTGLRPETLLAGLRFRAEFRPPHRFRLRPAYGPGTSDLADIKALTTEDESATIIFDLADALATIQEHTPARVSFPDLTKLTHGQLRKALDTARLLRGETLTTSWVTTSIVHLHPGIQPNTQDRFAIRLRDPLTVTLPGGELDVGIRNVDFPAGRVDPDSITIHDDHIDVKFVPAGNTLAIITYAGRYDNLQQPPELGSHQPDE